MTRSSETVIEDLERSYREAQNRMSDPSVYNDHREAAEVGRRLKELEGPYKLAQEWRATAADLVEWLRTVFRKDGWRPAPQVELP